MALLSIAVMAPLFFYSPQRTLSGWCADNLVEQALCLGQENFLVGLDLIERMRDIL